MGSERCIGDRPVTAGSIEERIVEMHRDKRALADGLLEGQDLSLIHI